MQQYAIELSDAAMPLPRLGCVSFPSHRPFFERACEDASAYDFMRRSFPPRFAPQLVRAAGIAIAIAIASASGASAQTNMNDLLDESKDLLIQQSLGSFSASIGGRIPVLIDHKSAYPTVRSLPGKLFAAKARPSITRELRTSKDGTVQLPPGDYAFAVDAFCMRANAESPNGYQYRIAPLRGSAADIIAALNARAPSSTIAHGVLQVLQWNIQAGVPYAGMAAPERAAIDALIPEFRNRFQGRSAGSAATEYASLARSIPGMPSLEQALQRIGPIGEAMSNLDALQHQLDTHPQEFEQLSRVLVPLGTATGSTAQSTAASRATPWSRYSEQVFARFITSGNFATPGSYQVRVTGRKPAAGPFSNIVADSGTDRVQSLTIAVRAPGGGATSPPPAPPQPEIISQTYDSVPGIPASRRTIGVAERVFLRFTAGQAIWSLASSGGSPADAGHLEARLGNPINYVAATDARTETITAEGARGSKATITFHVIAPVGIVQVKDPTNPLIHTFDRADVGFWAHTYLQPANVSFLNIAVREQDVCATASGVYLPADRIPRGHQPGLAWTPVIKVVENLGSLVDGHDQVWSGDPVVFPVPLLHDDYEPGYLDWLIPWFYALPSGAAPHQFKLVDTHFELAADKTTLTASKAGASTITDVEHATVGKRDGGDGSESTSGSTTKSGPPPPPLVCAPL